MCEYVCVCLSASRIESLSSPRPVAIPMQKRPVFLVILTIA